jgi:creatinine amidohydrolase
VTSADPVRLGDLSADAFRHAVKSHPVILLPLASQEDHGPHLPMGDYVLAEQLAIRIARTATDAGTPTFVAPVLPFGVADYFGASPGGMAVSAATFHALLHDLLASLLRHNLTKILILNGHGGNAPVIHDVTLSLKRTQQIIIPSFYLWKVARELMEARSGQGSADRFGHGGEPLLSLTLALRPQDVPQNADASEVDASLLGLPVSGFGTLNFNGITIDAPVEYNQFPRNVARAARPAASAALGEAVAAALVETAAGFVLHLAASAASASGVSKS